jgi:ferric-dicitrate binding protein FerR (iron transport regulator)
MGKFSFRDFTFEEVIRYIEGDSDEHISRVIEEWLAKNERNRKLFSQIKEVWLNRSELTGLMDNVEDRDFQSVIRKIHERQDNRQVKNGWFGSIPLLGRVAAVGLLLVAMGMSFLAGRIQNRRSEIAEVTYNELIVPKGQRSKVILCDGSSVWLNAESRLRFPSDFRGDLREVWLDGEGLFTVTKDSARLFFVHTENLDVKVHGTIFNLKAYSGDDIVETTVVEGLVSFEARDNKVISRKDVYLEPNRKAVYVINETARISEEVKREVNEPLVPKKIVISNPIKVEPVISWTEGRLIFTDETLGNIADKLEKKYDVEIQIEDDMLKSLRYTGILKNVSIEQALKAMQLTTGIMYTINENHIIISERIQN